jgi:hypothetical protein
MNVIIASRLETVKTCYVNKNIISNIPSKKIRLNTNIEPLPLVRILNIGDSVILNAAPVGISKHLVGTDNSMVRMNINTKANLKEPKRPSKSTATATSRQPQVIIQYTKNQYGRLIDTVVMKEPFKDRYAMFGIDTMSGQRYELHLSSG